MDEIYRNGYTKNPLPLYNKMPVSSGPLAYTKPNMLKLTQKLHTRPTGKVPHTGKTPVQLGGKTAQLATLNKMAHTASNFVTSLSFCCLLPKLSQMCDWNGNNIIQRILIEPKGMYRIVDLWQKFLIYKFSLKKV